MAGDREVEALAAEGLLEEAAALASERGDPARAAELWWRACRFDEASRAALAASDLTLALEAAARCGDPSTLEQAVDRARANPEAGSLARRLAERGLLGGAAALHAALREHGEAARCLEVLGDWEGAAAQHRAGGDGAAAVRCLRQALTLDPEQPEPRLALGRLLMESGRARAALRELQGLPADVRCRPEVGALLDAALAALGLSEGARAPAGASPPEPGAPELLFGRYRVLRQVASTATARVLQAEDSLTGQLVAVKLLAPSLVLGAGRDAWFRFEREAAITGKLRHPHVVSLLAYHPEGPALVTPWMSGGSLAERMAAGPLSPAAAVEVTCAVLDALDAAHRLGVLHRDVKPANVLFDEAGGAALADFGTAHLADGAATVTRGLLGTLGYLAPEVRSGAGATPATDVYGAGALLWEALHGAVPPGGAPLSPDLDDHHLACARRLVADAPHRPATAREARASLLELSWPSRRPEAVPAVTRAGTPAPPGRRLTPLEGSSAVDGLLGRRVRVLPLDDRWLPWARAVTRAAHPSLPLILAAHPEAGELWVEEPPGQPLHGPLTDEEYATLAAALERLHAAGAGHGDIDAAHVALHAGEPRLRAPEVPGAADRARDLEALLGLRR